MILWWLMYSVIDIDKKNIELIDEFLSGCKKSLETFRYFDSRDIFAAVSCHEATIILKRKNEVIGYAHLDKEGDNTWLGVCLVDKWLGFGLGCILIEEILKRRNSETIRLSVDKANKSAISLYQRYGFQYKYDLSDSIILMELSYDTNL